MKNHNLFLALDNHCQITKYSIDWTIESAQSTIVSMLTTQQCQLLQIALSICLFIKTISSFFFIYKIFIILSLFLRTLSWSISVCQDSDQIWHYKLLFYFVLYFVEKSLQFILCKSHFTLQIVWYSNRTTVDEFLVNLVKIIDENSSNLINQQFSKLLKMTEFWSIHDKNWSFFKLE